MSESDSQQRHLEKLEALKRENGVSIESAQREARCGPQAAYREELAQRSQWRSRKRKSFGREKSKKEDASIHSLAMQ
jgi:hypothetical protein